MQFKERFGCREFPVHSMIYRWVNKFRTHGTVHNLNGKDTNRQSHSARPKSSGTPHNVAAVRDSVACSPSKYVHLRSQELGINRETVRRILITDLQLYPYRIQIKQKLTSDDMRKRVIMCQWFYDKIEAMCQASLAMSGFWTRHIFCYQVTVTLRITFSGVAHLLSSVSKGHYTLKCTAWVAISKHGVIGPFWFEDDNEQSVTINTERYVQVLGKFWTALGQWRRVVRALQCFQQDGATPHTSNESLTWLQQRFPNQLISHRCDPEWSLHSPDLNPPDFYLWGYLKDRVFGNNPQTIPDLKAAITAAIKAILREECGRVIENFACRIQVCLQRRGAHLEHIFERQ